MKKEELFYIDKAERRAVLLGYIMPLTKSELEILTHINENGDYTRADEIMQAVFADKGITRGNTSVHVCAINRKARKISGRDLIECKRYKGYRIVDKI